MLLQILLTLEVLGFVFLALGLIPFNSQNPGYTLMNKIIFCALAGIIFFSLGVTATQYIYTDCYINQSTLNSATNITTNTANCLEYEVQDEGLSFLNMGMGVISFLILIVLVLFASLSYKAERNME